VAGNARRVKAFGPKLRESATESIPPMEGNLTGKGERVRQERTGGLATVSVMANPTRSKTA